MHWATDKAGRPEGRKWKPRPDGGIEGSRSLQNVLLWGRGKALQMEVVGEWGLARLLECN